GYGWWRLPRVEPGGEPLAVALVQANIPLEQKSAGDVHSLFYEHLGLTYEVQRGTRLVVWPETAVPTRLMHVPEFRERLQAAARALRATLVVGGVATIPAADPLATQVANAAFVLDDQGRLVDDYHKVHLVILGEYLPLRNWPLVSAIARLTPQFWAGSRYRAVATPLGRVGIPICYESAFPGDVRAMVKDGAGALVVITNDDQLSETGARQLFQQTVFRSVETRRWMARCANSGISCFVAPSGRVVSASEWDRRTLHTGMLRLHNGVTFYVRCGDWLPWLCLLVTAAALLQRRRGNEK
ncbi:MAG: apolipoprotein N-acyltransferase, partial [Armatimonadetes bacterium]|nr:apolipoprotein N-acyltransferase [Armatimonadota bacterium]